MAMKAQKRDWLKKREDKLNFLLEEKRKGVFQGIALLV